MIGRLACWSLWSAGGPPPAAMPRGKRQRLLARCRKERLARASCQGRRKPVVRCVDCRELVGGFFCRIGRGPWWSRSTVGNQAVGTLLRPRDCPFVGGAVRRGGWYAMDGPIGGESGGSSGNREGWIGCRFALTFAIRDGWRLGRRACLFPRGRNTLGESGTTAGTAPSKKERAAQRHRPRRSGWISATWTKTDKSARLRTRTS